MIEINPLTRREFARWYPLIDHPMQRALVTDKVRFKVVPAGRRSGKTERAKRFMASTAMATPNEMYFLAAPTFNQAKKIWWEDMKLLTFRSLQTKQPSESNLIITLDNNTTIHIIGLDVPARIEGQPWSGGIVDEIADCKPNAWELNIKPALNTVIPTRKDYRAWCWLIGVPDGLNHYYKICEEAKKIGPPLWGYYHWKSADILPPDIIEEELRSKGKKQFQQEYEASFETATGRIYEDYGPLNWTSETIAPHEQLWWHHDFNFTPMSSGIAVRRQEKTGTKRDCILILDEIILTSATARQSAIEFCDKFKDHKNKQVILYGDPAGRAGEKHGHTSDYTEIESELRKNGWTFERRVKSAAPAIKDRQNAVRAKIRNGLGHVSLFVNPRKAPYADEGLRVEQLKEGSTFLEDDKSPTQHITTAIGYMVDYIWPINGSVQKVGLIGS